jgi:hypothetical protein
MSGLSVQYGMYLCEKHGNTAELAQLVERTTLNEII